MALAGLTAIDEGGIGAGGSVLDEPASGRSVESRRRSIGVVVQDLLLLHNMASRDVRSSACAPPAPTSGG